MRTRPNLYVPRPASPPLQTLHGVFADDDIEVLPLLDDAELYATPIRPSSMHSDIEQLTIGIIGLGYVGLPLAPKITTIK